MDFSITTFEVNVEALAKRSVYPSAAARAAACAPMIPGAPGMFSTYICCPSARETLSASRRAMMSVPRPGPVGTISRIGRVGQVCACAPESAATASSTLPKSARTKGFMMPSKRSLRPQSTRAGFRSVALEPDPAFLDHFTPTLALSCNCCGEFLRRPQRQLQPLFRHPLTYLGSLERLAAFGIEPIDDRARRTCRRHESEPGAALQSREPHLRRSGYLGRHWVALR